MYVQLKSKPDCPFNVVPTGTTHYKRSRMAHLPHSLLSLSPSPPPCDCRKKVKQESEKEEKVTVESSASVTAVDGSVPPDAELWTHLQFVQNEVQGCPSTREQLEKLGRCVRGCVGVGVGVCTCVCCVCV